MANIPEGATTASGEGDDLKRAILAAAETLGVPPERVGHTIDLSHFRSSAGGMVAKRTVKVIAWALPEGETASSVATQAPAARPKKDREPREAREPREPREDKAADAEPRERKPRERKPRERSSDDAPRREASDAGDLAETEASKAAQAWFATLVDLMGLKGTVVAKGNDHRVVLDVDVDRAGQLIGRRGSTLSAIRHLLKLALSSFGDFVIDVEIPDARGGDKEERRGKDRDDGGKRGGRHGGKRREERSDDGPRGEYPEAKLKAVGERAAEKAKSTGKSVTINLLLNSYDRRIIHVAVQEIEGITSQSIVKDGKKYVQVLPDDED